MNATVFWRLVWKEYRSQRALWIAVAILAALIESWVLVLNWLGNGADQPGFIRTLYGVAFVHTWFYALGCGAVLFAAERENQTYEFQRSLPVTARRLFGAKVTFALASMAVLMGLLLLMAAALARWSLPDPDSYRLQWGVIGFAAIEALVWVTFFSLLLQGTVKAVIFGVTAASVTAFTLIQSTGGRGADLAAMALPWRAVVVALVAWADYELGRRWFRDATRGEIGLSGLGRRLRASSPAGVTLALPSRATMLGRLVWHHWRQWGWIQVAISAVGVAIAAHVIGLMMTSAGRRSLDLFYWWVLPEFFAFLFAFGYVAMIAPTLMGVFAFLESRRGHGDGFFAEHGVRPRYVWLSRQVIWAGLLAFWTVLLILAVSLWGRLPQQMVGAARDWGRETDVLGVFSLAGSVLVLAIMSCASGQFFSMFVRSGILAGFFGLALSLLLCVWAALMRMLGMSWAWSVAPIPAALLLATWLRAPDWVLGRRGWRMWLLPGLTLALPAIVLCAVVATIRVMEVPVVDPGFSVEEYGEPASEEARKTAQMYPRAAVLLPGKGPPSAAFLSMMAPAGAPQSRGSHISNGESIAARRKDERESLRLTLEATERPECDFLEQSHQLRHWNVWRANGPSFDGLADRLAESARQLQSEGKLDAALDRHLAVLRMSIHLRQRSGGLEAADVAEYRFHRELLDWAARPGQTPQRILGAWPRIEQILARDPGPAEPIKWRHWQIRRALTAGPEERKREESGPFALPKWVDYLPWERARALRVLDLVTWEELESLGAVEAAMAAGKNLQLVSFPARSSRRLVMTSVLVRDVFWYLHNVSPDMDSVVLMCESLESQRRASNLSLALEAWKLDHGSRLPASLDELKPKYLAQIPLDPCAGEPFRYYPAGVASELPTAYRITYTYRESRTIAAHEPFFWATGSWVRTRHAGVKLLDRYEVQRGGAWHEPTCEQDLLLHGWAYAIP